ncbi:hypothetical protein Goshw_016571 [Gossypium schwendimanii]|uniref:Uncharacterized protein n=1 Tax=Gossypium schwendimanii TaxID=34291 RepID=A0A7J9KSS7_GOSSC|nr:hypothetical protein [Gossypium schwendimanii]
MLTKQSPIYLTGLIRSFYLHGFTVTFRRWIMFRIEFSLKIIHH